MNRPGNVLVHGYTHNLVRTRHIPTDDQPATTPTPGSTWSSTTTTPWNARRSLIRGKLMLQGRMLPVKSGVQPSGQQTGSSVL